MKQALVALAAAAVLSPAASPVLAQEGLAGDGGKFQVAYEPGLVRVSPDRTTLLGVQFTGGWRFSHAFAVEAFAIVPIEFMASCSSSCGTEVRQSLGVRATGYLPLDERWDLMGYAGVASTALHQTASSATTGTRTDPVVGGGLMWRSSPRLSMGVTATWLAETNTPAMGFRSEWRF